MEADSRQRSCMLLGMLVVAAESGSAICVPEVYNTNALEKLQKVMN